MLSTLFQSNYFRKPNTPVFKSFSEFLPQNNEVNSDSLYTHNKNMHRICTESRERYIKKLVEEYKKKQNMPLSIRLGNEISAQLKDRRFSINPISISFLTILSIPSIIYFMERFKH